MSFRSMLEGLVAAGVRFVVVGGVAGVVHGSTRVTIDLDVCYNTTPDNIERLAQVLAGWEAHPRGHQPGMPFFMDERTIREHAILTLATREGALDLLARVEGVGDYASALARSVEVDAEEELGVRFRALDLRALIDSKRATGREKDRQQLPELEAILALMEQAGGQEASTS